ncbi:AsmA-like protein [Dysgonomonas alginatilytica]|uniref:AsmA-like protein n=1 Tax=Dysgonomonas alginatilytica TaxID=1605892 RepID=A0A2V3PPC2_9BACT|nr:AsmA family protein [Dysgonomonas alginatilytica]PXV65066.1 AsmA-like protein [Dysgonomonas alginatilytica]
MKKGVKKGLIIGGGVFIVLLAILISIPFLIKDKIKDAVINAASSSLNAELHINDFGVSIFSNFPNITLSLEDMSISGVGDFAGDTLLKAKSADVTLNIIQVLKGNYEVSKINMNGATVYAKVLTDGRTNWDIVKVDSAEVVPITSDTETGSGSSFKLKLQKVSLDNCQVTYDDQQSNMKVILTNWSGEVSGDFSAEKTTLKTKSNIGEVSFIMDGIPYLSKIKGTANATIDADMDKVKFTFVESDIQLNDVKASIDGSVAMVGEDGKDFDLKLKAPDTQFKDILSILPAMYTEDFKDIKTSGRASLDGFVKGLMQGEQYPAFDFKLLINNAMFQYPSLPKSVDNINVDMRISNKGGSFDNTVIDISKFNFSMAGNPFSASLNIQTPMSDASLKAHLKGIIDLAMIKEVYPLDKGIELNGKLTADLNIATRMSAIEKEQYQNVDASGSLKLNNMTYRSGDMQDVVINNAELGFTPQYVNLSSLDVKIGKNDISATGRLENFIAYALKNQTLKGQLNLKSNYFNLNDFMGESSTAATTESTSTSETTPSAASQSSDNFVVPTNLNFALNADMKQVVYEKVNITNLKGSIAVKDGTITMQDVTANALGGTAKVTGSYSTAGDPKNPKVTLNANISKASFAETFKSVETIQKFAPVFDKVLGNYSMNMNMNASMGDNLLKMLSGLTASGVLQANDVQVEGVEALNKLSSSLKTDALKSFSAKDVSIPFTINEGKINTKPFTVGIGDGGKLNLEGTTGLDQTINYKGSITLPKSMANAYLSNIPITIGGTFSDPKIGVDAKSLIGNLLGGDAVGKLLGGSANDKQEEVTAKVGEEKTKQIQKLREEAKTAGDKLVEESQKRGQQLVSAAEPKGAIAKLAAQTAADKLVSEAKKNAKKLTEEAEVQIKKLEAQ